MCIRDSHRPLRRDERPQRHSAAEGLGQADDVGRDAVALHGEERSRAPQSGLYFVEDEQCARAVAAFAQRFEPARSRQAHARFALHWLDEYGGRAAGDPVERLEIVEFDRAHVGQQRPESRLPLLAFGGAHHAHRAVRRTVVGAAHRDEFRAFGDALGQFERPFDRLGARIDEINAVERCGQRSGDPRGIGHLRRLDHFAVDHHVHVARRLLLHGAHHVGVAVADVAHRDARHQIVIAFPVGGVEERPLGPRDLDEHRRRRGLSHVGEKLFA